MREKRLQVRTHYIHRLQYSTQEKLVGMFVFLAISMLLWLLFSSGRSLIVFEEYYTLYGRLETIQPIDQKTKIVIGGLSAGRVQTVQITKDNHIMITMEILKRYRKLIRSDSIAQLNIFNLGLLNQSIIDISVGSPDRSILADGHTIEVTEAINIKHLLPKVIHTFTSLSQTIEQLNTIVSVIDPNKVAQSINHIETLIASIDPEQTKASLTNLHIISDNARQISDKVNAGEGIPVSIESIDKLVSAIDLEKLQQTGDTINELLAAINPTLISTTVDNIQKTMAHIQDITQQIKQGDGLIGSAVYGQKTQKNFEQTLANLKQATYRLDQLLIILKKTVKNMPELLNKIEPLIDEADRTIKATQKIWPLSSTIESNKIKNTLTAPGLIND